MKTKQEKNDEKKLSNNDKQDASGKRHQMIEYAAYFHAEKRNFTGGDPIEDWLAAEEEIDNIFKGSNSQ